MGSVVSTCLGNKKSCRHAKTRKLCCRKDDRAMRRMYGCPENVREALSTLTVHFPKFLMGFCFDPMNVRTKFKVRSFTRT